MPLYTLSDETEDVCATYDAETPEDALALYQLHEDDDDPGSEMTHWEIARVCIECHHPECVHCGNWCDLSLEEPLIPFAVKLAGGVVEGFASCLCNTCKYAEPERHPRHRFPRPALGPRRQS